DPLPPSSRRSSLFLLPYAFLALLFIGAWALFTRASGDDDEALSRLPAATLDVRAGGGRDLLVANVRAGSQSRWVDGAVRGYALVLRAELEEESGRDPIGFLRRASEERALFSGILALGHLRDRRVAPILAYLIQAGNLYSEAAVRATVNREDRF